jgi:hypothetical protein
MTCTFELADVKRAARLAPEAARDTASRDCHDTPAADKALAIWLYQIGARNEVETAASFARHPEWRSA